MKHRTKYRFPWRNGNRFELLVDGRNFFPRMLEAIDASHRSISLEIYLLESGELANRVIEALVRAARRGVTIRLLADDYGASRFTAVDRSVLMAAGVRLCFYNPVRPRKWLGNLFRDHRKLMIVDDEIAFVSGTGITDDFLDNPSRPGWRETAVRVSGPLVADWCLLFAGVWREQSGETVDVPNELPERSGDGMTGRVVPSATLRNQGIRRSLFRHVHKADSRVWLATAYFVPSRKMLRALRAAAQRGVDVRLLVPGPRTDHPAVRHAGRRFYSGLLGSGARIFEYQPRFLHAKTLLCDDWSAIGSSNFDRWNLRWNLEANQEIRDPVFAEEVKRMFENDFEQSVEIDFSSWRRRGFAERFREQVWGRVDAWLESLGRRRVH